MTHYIKDSDFELEYEEIFNEWYEIECARKIKELSRQLRTFFNYKTEVIRYRFRSTSNLAENDTNTKYYSRKQETESLTREFIILLKQFKKNGQALEQGIQIKAIHFRYFKKFISWENIPSEFPQDIFELPAEIIHILAMICVDNFYKTKTKTLDERLPIRRGLIHKLKKRFIIENVNGGVCPACGEFNIRDHLPSFHFNHFYESSEITPEEKRRREEYKITELYRTFSCSELVEEMERQKGGYVCGNCHFVIHTKIELIDKIYDDKNITKEVINDRNKTIKKFEQNLICSLKSIKDPLKLDMRQESLSLMNYLFALYEISEEKGVITSLDLQEKLKISRTSSLKFFAKRKELLEKLGNIIPARGCIPVKYHMNIDGKRIVCLMHYFKEYYQNLTS